MECCFTTSLCDDFCVVSVRKPNPNESIVGTGGFTRCGYVCLTKELVGDQKMYLDAAEYPLEGTIEIRSICNSSPSMTAVDFNGFLVKVFCAFISDFRLEIGYGFCVKPRILYN